MQKYDSCQYIINVLIMCYCTLKINFNLYFKECMCCTGPYILLKRVTNILLHLCFAKRKKKHVQLIQWFLNPVPRPLRPACFLATLALSTADYLDHVCSVNQKRKDTPDPGHQQWGEKAGK